MRPAKLLLLLAAVQTGMLLGAADFNVRDFGAAGDGKTDDLPAFRKAAQTLRESAPGSTLIIPAGVYRLSDSWLPEGWKDVNVAGEAGAELRFDSLFRDGIKLQDCERFSIKGLLMGFATPASISGPVISQPDPASLVVAIPDLDQFPVEKLRTMLHIFSPEGRMDHRVHRTDVRKIERVQPGRFRITFEHPIRENMAGLTAVLFLRGGRPVMNLNRCSDGVLENLHVRNGGDLAFGLRYCNAMTFRGCRITSTDPARFVTLGADGIHSKHGRQGPLIEDCDFSGMSDDAVNLSTTMQNIASIDGASAILVGDNYDYRPGDRVALFDPETSAVIQQTRVVKAVTVKWNQLEALNVTFAEPLKTDATLERMRKTEPFRLLFGHKGALPGLVYNLESAHSGTVIRNNRFGNNRARGLLLRTSDTLIENNLFYNLRGPGVLIAFEGMWMECGRVENVTIRNNRFESVSRSPVLFGTIAYTSKREAGERLYRNLAITGNVFEDCGAPAIEGGDTFGLFGNLILLENVENATVTGNRFGKRSPLVPRRDAVMVGNSESVQISGNVEE